MRTFSIAGELQETLQARAGVLWALPLVAVRQEHHEPRGLAPLGLARDDELVDHGLPHVGEVPVLGLPEDQRVVGVHGVAVLEAHHRYLRERAVVDREGGLRLRDVLHRDVVLADLLVVQDEVALGEGAALGVLAGQPDRDPVGQQRGERERLGVGPVDPVRRSSFRGSPASSARAARAWSSA